jgi:hypothetical protein
MLMSRASTFRRRPPDFTPVPAAEMLEHRVVLSAIAALPTADTSVTAITDVNVDVVDGKLFASATVVGTVEGEDFSQTIALSLGVAAGVGDDGAALQVLIDPVHVEAAGLELNLVGAAGGAVAINVQDVAGEGSPLGDVLDEIAALADEAGAIDLGELTGDQLDALKSGLEDVVESVFNELTASDPLIELGGLLQLEIDAINLEVAGLNVETGPIALSVVGEAEAGVGGLLDNLLGDGSAVAGVLGDVEDRIDEVLADSSLFESLLFER